MTPLESLIQIRYCYEATVSQISIGLLLYSHIPAALFALCFGLFLMFKQRNTVSKSFFALCFTFALWCFLDLNSWSPFLGAENTMFTWSLVDMVGLLFFFFAYHFLYTYVTGARLPSWQLMAGVLLILPTIVTTFFGLNLTSFDADYCEAVEHEWVTLYPYAVQFIFIAVSIFFAVKTYSNKVYAERRREIFLTSLGILLFLSFFFSASFVVSLMVNYTSIANPYNYEIYGLFGMPILLAFIGYLIVKYRAFAVEMAGVQALVAAILALTGAEFFFVANTTNQILVTATFLFVALSGYFLIRSVKREIAAREREEALVHDLARVNVRLRELDRQKSEFVSIASHQLRSPLTAIRGYASLLMEGSFGKIPAKAVEAVERIHESSGFMALSIEDFLNVSRIEQGRMKYEFADTNVREMASKVVDELRTTALKKGLVLLFRSQCDGSGIANIDPGKMRQVIYNLVDNALKYTQKGSVTVLVTDNLKAKRLRIAIIDTGVGMSEETLHKIFDKFVRAKNANQVNVSGTGLGLYVAKQMVEAMRGRVIPSSPGEGKGSTFAIELSIV